MAVLDRTRTNAPNSDWLYMLCVYRDGRKVPENLRVHAKGTQPSVHPSWEYEIRGDSLHITPSVWISTTKPSESNPNEMVPVELFHNDGAWDIRFKEFIPGDYVQAYDLFRALNPKE